MLFIMYFSLSKLWVYLSCHIHQVLVYLLTTSDLPGYPAVSPGPPLCADPHAADQELQTTAQEPNPNSFLLLSIKLYWCVAMSICIQIVYDYFPSITTVDLRSCYRDPMAHKA